MKIKSLDGLNKRDWNKFILENEGSFLQSWEWGEFQESVERRVFRFRSELDLESRQGLIRKFSHWQAQFIEIPLPFGKKYWYCPYGPVTAINDQESTIRNLENLIEKIKESAKQEGVIFFRIGPEWLMDIELEAKLEIIGFRKLRYDIEPSQTLILDITKSEPKLLAQMHSKWRYNIGLARKKGVRVKISDRDDVDFNKYFENFRQLIQQTAKRQKIRLHNKEYYRKQLAISSAGEQTLNGTGGNQFQNLLFTAEYKKKVVAANIVNFFNQRATYLHGGSDNEQRVLMAPHLLQWRQIGVAKKLGCTGYDFWGINEKKWPGVTRFKLGFGGQEVKYIGTWDYPLDRKWYLLYRGVQKFRR